MKILIHSNAPWEPSGYGQQTALLLPALESLGHIPAVSAFNGLSGHRMQWGDGQWTVYPRGQAGYGTDVVLPHAVDFGADLILTLMDYWQMYPVASALQGRRIAAWIPNDCEPLGRPDIQVLRMSGAVPIAMSNFGLTNMRNVDLDNAMYAPHAVDTDVFAPRADRAGLREELALPADHFIIGICAANRDLIRKGFPEQFTAFARFHRKHPDTTLMVHSEPHSVAGRNLTELAEDLGIADSVLFSDAYAQLTGVMGPEIMADWYAGLDVLSSCSYGEGFGIPLIEAQACGTPVIATDCSAMTELSANGWSVLGEPFWNPTHRAWWKRPRVDSIVRAYEKAYEERGTVKADRRRERSREFAMGYDIRHVAVEYWKPILETLAES